MKGAVTFYFDPGSRYSYLASTQLPRISEETGARFIWRAVYSPELIVRAGSDPFHAANRRGQYRPEYRAKDVQRWAALYGIPYSEPDWNRVNWRRLALACVAADRRGAGDVYANNLLTHRFSGKHPPPATDDDLIDLARLSGLASHHFIADLAHDETERLHTQNIERALAAGAFGVPTFVTDAGEVFSVKTGCPFSGITYGEWRIAVYGSVRKTDCDRPANLCPAS
jgi:2-hydroxychromene-2-carboxylate isomerase